MLQWVADVKNMQLNKIKFEQKTLRLNLENISHVYSCNKKGD
jgi:hypothetical protein